MSSRTWRAARLRVCTKSVRIFCWWIIAVMDRVHRLFRTSLRSTKTRMPRSTTYGANEQFLPINCSCWGDRSAAGLRHILQARYSGLGGLILESPFTSIDDAARAIWYLRIYPISIMLRTHFANASRIGSVRIPVLIVAGTSDTLTPSWMAEEIFARANSPRQLYLVPHAGHDDLVDVGGNALVEELRKFIQSAR